MKKGGRKASEGMGQGALPPGVVALLEEAGVRGPEGIQEKIPDASVACLFLEAMSFDGERWLPFLEGIEKAWPDKQVQKAVRRALFKLRSRGVRPVDPEPRPKGPVFAPLPKEPPKACLGPIDYRGVRGLMFFYQKGHAGMVVTFALVSDDSGILECSSGAFSRNRVREIRTHFEKLVGPFVETSLSHAFHVSEVAFACTNDSNSAEALAAYRMVRPDLQRRAGPYSPPRIQEVRTDLEVPASPLSPTDVAALFSLAFIREWAIDPEPMAAYQEEVEALSNAVIILSDPLKADRAGEAKRRCIETFFTEERRARLKTRLQEMAYLFHCRGEEDAAILAWKGALSVPQGQEVPWGDTFLHGFFVHTLALAGLKEGLVSQAQEGQAPASPLILPAS